jgi:aryl-alcohol dehydrogenase-like predicted oxidoreductase
MEYRQLGRSGLKVSELCLGSMTFGAATDQAEAQLMVDLAFDAGVNFFDTADSYAAGESEVMLGKALGGRRDHVILATKYANPMGPSPNDAGISRYHVMRAIEGSLRRLGTDHVDIYYVHHVDADTPAEEMLRAMDDLVHAGKVRYIACSNYEAWRLCDALWISDSKDLARFVCYQAQYSLVVRDIEQELIPLCRHKQLGVVAWSPLAGGFLSGKYAAGQRSLAGSRSEKGWVFPARYFPPNADETLVALLQAASSLGRTPAQVALRWLLAQPAVASVIVGARSAEQLRDNLRASTWRLDETSVEDLSRVSHLPERYPASLEKNMGERRRAAVKMSSWRDEKG